MTEPITKRILMTGATSGIGYQASIYLIKKGYKLEVLCRNKDRVEYLLDKMQKDNVSMNQIKKYISFYVVDLSDLDSIEKFLDQFLKKKIVIDTLILNAGLQYTGSKEIRRSSQNIELTFAVNHLSHHFLAQGLFPSLIQSDHPRIVVTASEVHNPDSPGGKIGDKASLGNMDGIINSPYFKMIDGAEDFNADKAYKDSKLCNILFAREMFRRLSLRKLEIPIICWAPGLVIPRGKDGFFRYSRKYNECGQILFAFIARDLLRITESEQNAGEILMRLASLDQYNDNRFVYYSNKIGKPGKMIFSEDSVSKEALDNRKAEKLWEISNEIITKLSKQELASRFFKF